jgi:hypothetical protein
MPQEINTITIETVADDLDSVKTIMFTLARQYERIDHTVDRIALQQEINSQAIQAMANAISSLAMAQQQQLTAIQEMQSEVRGLQVENRRILQHIFKEEEF